MKKHLVLNSTTVMHTNARMIEVGHWQYLQLRLDFKKWRLHRTMFRPVLLLRKEWVAKHG